jgi:hypothetical protein
MTEQQLGPGVDDFDAHAVRAIRRERTDRRKLAVNGDWGLVIGEREPNGIEHCLKPLRCEAANLLRGGERIRITDSDEVLVERRESTK